MTVTNLSTRKCKLLHSVVMSKFHWLIVKPLPAACLHVSVPLGVAPCFIGHSKKTIFLANSRVLEHPSLFLFEHNSPE